MVIVSAIVMAQFQCFDLRSNSGGRLAMQWWLGLDSKIVLYILVAQFDGNDIGMVMDFVVKPLQICGCCGNGSGDGDCKRKLQKEIAETMIIKKKGLRERIKGKEWGLATLIFYFIYIFLSHYRL